MGISARAEKRAWTCRYASVNSSSAHPPPGQPRGIYSRCQSRGWDIRNLLQPGDWAFAYPGATPGYLTRVFESAMDEFNGKDEAFLEQWLGTRTTCRCFIVCFLNFGYFFIYLKYLMLKTKYKGINIIRSN